MTGLERIKQNLLNASDAIDFALEQMTEKNRGEIARNLLKHVRDLNDSAAYIIHKELYPESNIKIKDVASKFNGIKNMNFIGVFHYYLRKSLSHFTPNSDGAERLMIKYYQYILQLKKLFKDRYNIEIVRNIDKFLLDLDTQTKEYYEKVAKVIKKYPSEDLSRGDNYYISDIKSFFVNHEIYYEVVFEPALNKSNKFNRVVAFTKWDIQANYCVSLNIKTESINVFGVDYPINIITGWNISIRPCELMNMAKLVCLDFKIQRNNGDYKYLMKYLKENYQNLLDIIDYPLEQYNVLKEEMLCSTKLRNSKLVSLLDKCRQINQENITGKNIVRYTLVNLNYEFIKDQFPKYGEEHMLSLKITRKSYAFEKNPYAFNFARRLSNLNTLFYSIDLKNHEAELLYRCVKNYTNEKNCIFVPIEELSFLGNEHTILSWISIFNNKLIKKHKKCQLAIYKNKIYIEGQYEIITDIFNEIFMLSYLPFQYENRFSEEYINELVDLDSIEKKEILINMFKESRVKLIYGAAGTGKTRLIKHVSDLLPNCRKLFLTKTNAAKNNIKTKIKDDGNCFYFTIDKYLNNYKYNKYDLIVIDECSTVENEEILEILKNSNNAAIILVGDIYQIEAIGLGNWFYIAKNYFDNTIVSELEQIQRSNDEGLLDLWKMVREYKKDNSILENVVANQFSHSIDKEIFNKKADDEIVLCLNYNGLYGLNNINRLMQLSNPNPSVHIGIWEFKVDDPILFNDSNRFEVLHNNLKGRIKKIDDYNEYVMFDIEVEKELTDDDCFYEEGMKLISSSSNKSVVQFKVNRWEPYESDEEKELKENVLPFQISYAVSIHKSQGLEYDSVKIVIADENEERITHSIFYTAITRAKNHLTLYWSPEVCNRVIKQLEPNHSKVDYQLIKQLEKGEKAGLCY